MHFLIRFCEVPIDLVLASWIEITSLCSKITERANYYPESHIDDQLQDQYTAQYIINHYYVTREAKTETKE